ncbi:MAG TPA: hypothetical protein VMZ33_01290 [Candidatus Limnocylindrales bacterium]|nr:hypothetical protein [Candidatus Limnocylindrales bacterium]
METDEDKVARLREQIPATSAGIYLDTAYRGPLPAETATAMREADDWELRVGRATDGRDHDVLQRHDEARAVLAALIGADLDAITVTPGIESAAGLVQNVLGVGPERIQGHVDPSTGEVLADPASEGSVVLDVSMSAGAIPLMVANLNADALIFATDRWLLGPENLACVWLKQPVAGIEMAIARTPLLGLARTVGWLEMYVGLEWIYARGTRLAGLLHDLLSATAGVDVVTPREAMATIVSFRLPAWPVDDGLAEIRRRCFAIIGSSPHGDLIRASIAWFNTDEEIERFANAVAEIARHTPETLPRRPTLVVH